MKNGVAHLAHELCTRGSSDMCHVITALSRIAKFLKPSKGYIRVLPRIFSVWEEGLENCPRHFYESSQAKLSWTIFKTVLDHI